MFSYCMKNVTERMFLCETCLMHAISGNWSIKIIIKFKCYGFTCSSVVKV